MSHIKLAENIFKKDLHRKIVCLQKTDGLLQAFDKPASSISRGSVVPAARFFSVDLALLAANPIGKSLRPSYDLSLDFRLSLAINSWNQELLELYKANKSPWSLAVNVDDSLILGQDQSSIKTENHAV